MGTIVSNEIYPVSSPIPTRILQPSTQMPLHVELETGLY